MAIPPFLAEVGWLAELAVPCSTTLSVPHVQKWRPILPCSYFWTFAQCVKKYLICYKNTDGWLDENTEWLISRAGRTHPVIRSISRVFFVFLQKWLPIKSEIRKNFCKYFWLLICFGVIFVKLVLIGQKFNPDSCFRNWLLDPLSRMNLAKSLTFSARRKKEMLKEDIFKEEERLCLNVQHKVLLIKSWNPTFIFSSGSCYRNGKFPSSKLTGRFFQIVLAFSDYSNFK